MPRSPFFARSHAPTAASSLFLASSGTPAASRLLQTMRTSSSSSSVVSAAHLDAGDAFPSPSAVFGLAGGVRALTSPARQVGPVGQVISLRLITVN